VEEAAKVEARDCAVIGCGVVGLSTARLLQLRGYNPVIYTKDMPPGTTSNIAGGYWDPTTVFDNPQVTPAFRQQFVQAAQFAFRRYQSMTGTDYGVRWLPVYGLSTSGPYGPAPASSPYSEINPLYPETRFLAGAQVPFDVPYARRRYSMLNRTGDLPECAAARFLRSRRPCGGARLRVGARSGRPARKPHL
jgi:glycine/D-amino acid oxidase-like deaminating enzyme